MQSCSGWHHLRLRKTGVGVPGGKQTNKNTVQLLKEEVCNKMFYPEHGCMIAWNDARQGVCFKTLFQNPLQQLFLRLKHASYVGLQGTFPRGGYTVPLLWRPVTTSPVGIEPLTISRPRLITEIQNITPRILRFARAAGPPIPPMIVLKHGKLK